MRRVVACVLAAAVALAVPVANPRSAALADDGALRNVNPDVDFPNLFGSVFKGPFLEYLNAQNITGSDGQPLHFVEAEILGFPSMPLPTSGSVSRDMLAQSGGMKYMEGEPIIFAVKKPRMVPEMAVSTLWENNSQGVNKQILSYSKSFTSEQSITIAGGVEVGVSMEFEVEVPGLAEGTLSPSIGANMQAGQTTTESKTTTWELSEEYEVPANSILNATCFIATGEIDTTWSGTLELQPSVPVGWVYYDDRERTKDSGNFWLAQEDLSYEGLQRWRKLLKIKDTSFRFQVPISGSYNGVSAAYVQVITNQCKYRPDTSRCDPK